MADRDQEQAAIAAFIAGRGVTKCPPVELQDIAGERWLAEIKNRSARAVNDQHWKLRNAEVRQGEGAALTDLFPELATTHDPGGSRRFRLQPGVRGSAEFAGPKREYRQWLRRDWGEPDAPYMLWIGMNPSTAEALVDDPTIRREIGFTRRSGLTSLIKVNVMDYRATRPMDLLAPGVRPCSGKNLSCIVRLSRAAWITVAAWGTLPKPLRGYANAVAAAIDWPICCLGQTGDGSPRHPLYVRGETELIRWTPHA